MCHISWFEILNYRIEPINIHNYLLFTNFLFVRYLPNKTDGQVIVFSTGIISVECKFSLLLVQMKLHSSSYCVAYLSHFIADC